MSDRPANPAAVIPSVADYLDAVFGDSGYLAQRFGGYKIRSGQVAMARAVDHAIRAVDGRRHLIAEGPTGTGKSLAYLIPATYHAALRRAEYNASETTDATDPKVVVATANIALQEQLVAKDLPLLQEILPWQFTFALLKGINNYLCVDALEDTEDEMDHGFPWVERLEDDEYQQCLNISAWARETNTGDVNELSFIPGKIWPRFSTTSEDCKKGHCECKDRCFALYAQQLAKQSDVLVTNYHLLFADMAVQLATDGFIHIIPPYQIAILDEAHKAVDIAREFFGFRLTRRGIAQTINRRIAQFKKGVWRDGIPESCAAQVEQTVGWFFSELETHFRSKEYRTRLKHCEVAPAWKKLVNAVSNAKSEMESAISRTNNNDKAQAKMLDLGVTYCNKVMTAVSAAMTLEREPEVVYYLEQTSSGSLTLMAKVVDVSGTLTEELFAKIETVVVTSATLSTDGKFNFIAKEFGAPPKETLTLIAESPFSAEQALLIVPTKDVVSLPTETKEYKAGVPRAMEQIVRLSNGRALCLFTSHANLRATAERLRRCGLPFHVLVQGDKPRTQLVQEFKADESSVLLGTESFWAGVDVPGPALSVVVIDRIPFPTPEDPVLDAISAHDDRWFFTYSVPRAQIQLKQGVGRLIRSVTDVGVVVILDRRIVEKSYGAGFLKSLPGMLKSRKLESLKEFLEEI